MSHGALVHDDPTVVLPSPIVPPTTATPGVPPLGSASVPFAPAPVPPPADDARGLKVAAALLAVLVLLLGGAVGVLVTRSSAATAASAAGTTPVTIGADLGDATSGIGGRAVTTTAPTTAPPAPTTTVPTAPPAPTTTAPSAPPATTPPTTTPPLTITVAAPAKVNCTNGGTPYLTVSWNAPGAVGVDLAIDGPGVYRHYAGAAGSDSVPFACDGPHTYTFTAAGAGASDSQVVVVESYKVLSPPPTLTTPLVSIPVLPQI